MADRLFVISFRWVDSQMKTTDLEPAMGELGNWARLNGRIA